jgi:hypothetical protein
MNAHRAVQLYLEALLNISLKSCPQLVPEMEHRTLVEPTKSENKYRLIDLAVGKLDPDEVSENERQSRFHRSDTVSDGWKGVAFEIKTSRRGLRSGTTRDFEVSEQLFDYRFAQHFPVIIAPEEVLRKKDGVKTIRQRAYEMGGASVTLKMDTISRRGEETTNILELSPSFYPDDRFKSYADDITAYPLSNILMRGVRGRNAPNEAYREHLRAELLDLMVRYHDLEKLYRPK